MKQKTNGSARDTRGPRLTEQVMIRLEPDLLARMKDAADADDRTVAQLVRIAIKRYLDG